MKEIKIVRIMTVFALVSALAFSITAIKFSPGYDYPLEAVRIEQIETENTQQSEIQTEGHYINMKEYVISDPPQIQSPAVKPQTQPVPPPVQKPVQPPVPQAPAMQFPMDINIATKEALMEVKGIGEKKAQDILDYRQRRGRIKSMQELLEVKGIGEKTLQKLCEKFYVG